MRAVLYLRSSSLTQKDSLELQRAATRARVDREGWEFVREYVDEGVSGMTPLAERPQGASLVADAERGEVDVVVAYHRNRLFRTDLDAAVTLTRFHCVGTRVVLVDGEPIDEMGRGTVLESIRAFVLAAESQKMRDRVIAISRLRAQRGQHLPARPPLGYRWHGDKTAGYVMVPAEAAIIREIFERSRRYGERPKDIADALNQSGIGTGKPWTAPKIRRILDNPVYTGFQRVTIQGERFCVRSPLIPAIMPEEPSTGERNAEK